SGGATGCFTWEWGDGTATRGCFPQTHTYTDTNKNYIVRVTSHYTNGTTDYEEEFVEFGGYAAVGLPDPYLDITIADANLKRAVHEALGLQGAPIITRGDMQCLTTLHAWDQGIVDLTGLEYADDLTTLSIPWNQISDIGQLSGLTNLTVLDLNGSRVIDITPAAGLVNLTHLHLGGNQISDISALAGNTELVLLHLWDNHISDISVLSDKHKLVDLELRNNQISDISALAGKTQLAALSIGVNLISDLSALTGLTGLERLSLRDNQFDDIESLANLTGLTLLDLANNTISDISVVAGMPNLQELNIHGNSVSDITSLGNLIKLEYLGIDGGNSPQDLSPLAGLTNLTILQMSGSTITDISFVENLIHLEFLRVVSSPLADISPLSGLINLNRLELAGNGIRDISALTELSGIDHLDLRWNPLSTFSHTTAIPEILLNNPGIELLYEEPVWQTLSIDSTTGGSVVIPGEGDFEFVQNEIVTVQAVPDDTLSVFTGWVGSAVESGSVQDPDAAFTQVTVTGNGNLSALFTTLDTSIELDRELEIRGRLYCDDPDGPLCLPGAHQLDVLPDSSEVFVLERLEIQSGVTLTLADHFHDHAGDPFDVLYVRDLVLAEGAELNLAGQRLYYETLSGQSGQIVNRKIYKSKLSSATFGDPITLDNDVTTNNTPEQIFVELVDDVNIAPEPVIHLQNQASEAAHAKIRLGRFSEDEVIVSFSYLFSSNQPGVVLEAYLSDQHGLLPLDDPHMLLAGRIVPPILGCPGSLGSGLFASYTLPVDVTLLDPNQGLWLELILSEPALTMQGFSTMAVVMPAGDPSQGGAYIYDPALSSMCLNICMDLTGDGFVSAEDYTLVSAGCGRALDMSTPNTSPLSCIDRGYSQDRYADASDLVNWGDLIARSGSADSLNLCSMPMVWEDAGYQVGTAFMSYGVTVPMAAPEAVIYSDLLFLGKGSTFIGNQEFVGYKDMLQGFDSDGASSQAYTLSSNQGQMRLVQGERDVHILDGDKGLCQLNGDVVVGPSQQIFQGKKVTLGIQNNAGQALRGRPLRDASFHNGFAYVVPVIVQEPDGVVYQAGAKLKLIGQDYEIRQLYYDPDLASVSGQSPNLRGLREIEVDSDGRVYLLNAYNQNGSNLLWAFSNAGELLNRHFLDRLSESIQNPVGLCYDTHSERLYVASGVFDKTLPNQSIMYGYDRPAVLSQDALVPIQKITINDLQHITSISSDQQGTLWATGFTLTDTPEILDASVLSDPLDRPLPGPRLTQVDTSGEGT
ncbi:MAG: leucine-rich repeat domain-containing protein, partial [Phycisphaeraceae bacterium]|nr:leucine-rich repeat domain-containing protein [Phycisphaeraceae bacterium]